MQIHTGTESFEWTQEERDRLCAVMGKIFGWKRHIVIDRVWIDTLKRDLGQEVERVVKGAIANNAIPGGYKELRYDVCLDWIIDRALDQLTAPDLFNDGGGI